jgi:hypothetical protein
VFRSVPGHALPFEAFPSAAAVPSSPTGDTFSPLQVAALVVVAVANRGADSAGGCRPQGLAPLPKSGCRMLLPAVLSRCSPGLHPEEGGWKMLPRRRSGQAAPSRDRNRSPGRTRVHPVYRPRSDLDDGATSPRLIRWILWGSVYPEEDLATALRRAGRAGSVRRHGVATPHPGQRAAKQPAEPRWPKIAFSFPSVTDMRCLPDSHRPVEPRGFAR